MNLKTLSFRTELRCCYPNCHAQIITTQSAYADAIDAYDLHSFTMYMFRQNDARISAEHKWHITDDLCFCPVHTPKVNT